MTDDKLVWLFKLNSIELYIAILSVETVEHLLVPF